MTSISQSKNTSFQKASLHRRKTRDQVHIHQQSVNSPQVQNVRTKASRRPGSGAPDRPPFQPVTVQAPHGHPTSLAGTRSIQKYYSILFLYFNMFCNIITHNYSNFVARGSASAKTATASSPFITSKKHDKNHETVHQIHVQMMQNPHRIKMVQIQNPINQVKTYIYI